MQPQYVFMMLIPDAKLNERLPALQHGSHTLQMEWQCTATPNTPISSRAETEGVRQHAHPADLESWVSESIIFQRTENEIVCHLQEF